MHPILRAVSRGALYLGQKKITMAIISERETVGQWRAEQLTNRVISTWSWGCGGVFPTHARSGYILLYPLSENKSQREGESLRPDPVP